MDNPRNYMRAHPECMRLYAVTDGSWLKGRTLASCIADAVRGGVTFVQLRDKHASTETRVKDYAEIRKAIGAQVPFVINDDVEAALRADADGVHVGQSDADCRRVRSILGPEKIIGVSARTVEQARAAQEAGADYLGVGAVFPTSTKSDAAGMSIELLTEICHAVSIPVVAIGGMNAQRVVAVKGSGVQGVAVVSALFAEDDIVQAARCLREAIDDVV